MGIDRPTGFEDVVNQGEENSFDIGQLEDETIGLMEERYSKYSEQNKVKEIIKRAFTVLKSPEFNDSALLNRLKSAVTIFKKRLDSDQPLDNDDQMILKDMVTLLKASGRTSVDQMDDDEKRKLLLHESYKVLEEISKVILDSLK